jgi:hypothetical protein
MNRVKILFLQDWGIHIREFYFNAAKVVVFFYLLGVLSKEYIINLNDDFTKMCNEFRKIFNP